MATYTTLPSGHIRAQVGSNSRRKGKTFPTKREAKAWATAVEAQSRQIAAFGFAPPPKGATLGDLIDKYLETLVREPGDTKAATLAMFKRKLGSERLASLNQNGGSVLREFIDVRIKEGASGATIAEDLSFLSAVLKWGRNARQLDLPERLALDARASLKYRGLETRSTERKREPTDNELERLTKYWRANPWQRIDMATLCEFADATAMRLGEMCRLQVEDVDRAARTVIIRDRKDPQRKLGNDQTVPLLPRAWAIVAPRIKDRTSGSLFGVKAASVSTAFTRTCAALEIEDLHFHDIRHRATAALFRMGLDIPQVALMTGHKTWTMLRRYTAIKPADVHAAVAPSRKSRHR